MTMPLHEEHTEPGAQHVASANQQGASENQQAASNDQQAATQSSAELIQEVIFVAQDMGARYKKQLSMSSELVQREWHLSLRALMMAVAGMLFLVIVGSLIWLALNGLVAILLLELNIHIAIISVLILLLNMLTAAALFGLIRKLLSQVGFKRSWSAITMSNPSSS